MRAEGRNGGSGATGGRPLPHTNAGTGSAAALTHRSGANGEPSTGRHHGGNARMQAFPHTRRAHAYATHTHAHAVAARLSGVHYGLPLVCRLR